MKKTKVKFKSMDFYTKQTSRYATNLFNIRRFTLNNSKTGLSSYKNTHAKTSGAVI